jgi:hypothetical protein
MAYYCTNKSADELIDPDLKDMLALPPEFTAEDMEMIRAVSAEAEELHAKIWTEFKVAAGQS